MNGNAVDQVIILALLMLLGAILRKCAIITDAVNKGMADLLVNVSMPMLMVASFNFQATPQMLRNAGMVLLCSTLIHVALIVLCWLVYARFKGERKRIFSFATIFSNSGFVGLPVVQGLYGNMGVFYASIYSIPFNIFIWSYGVTLFSGQKDWRSTGRNLVNMPLISTAVGLLLFLCSIHLPNPVQKTCVIVGGMTTPLSMFIIGSMLANVHPRDIFRGLDVYFLSVMRLIVAPLLTYLGLRYAGVEPLLLDVCVVLIAMPTASIVGVFAERYNSNRALASRCAFLTTILSLFTLPIVLAHL